MTVTRPSVALDARYPIGKAAEVLGVHRNTLRKATEEGRIEVRICKANGRKVFTGRELIRYWSAEI